MSKLNRILAALGVVYLLTVGGLYLALNARNEEFHRNGETITGTVVRIEQIERGTWGPWRSLMHDSGRNVAVISYTNGSATDHTTSNPYRGAKYQVGEKVPLVIYHSASGKPADDIVAVKDRTLLALRILPWAFIAAGLVAAWYFAVRTHPELFSRRSRPKTSATTSW